MPHGIGELFSILSAAAWAVGVILYRRLGESLPPLQLNFLKNCLVFMMLIPAIPLLHGFALPSFSGQQIFLSVLSGLIGIGLADTLYFRALSEVGAGRMGILGNFYSPFVLLLSFLFLGDRLNPWQWCGFALVSSGVFLASKPSAVEASRPAHYFRGLMFGLLSIGLMAISIILVKRVLEAQPLLWVTGLRMLGAVIGMVLIAAFRQELFLLKPPKAMRWKPLIIAAFVGQFVAMVFWLAGYKFTSASVAAILNETASVFILLLAWLWLKEPLTRRGLIGVGLTLSGVSFMLWARS
ncbi:MAG TPA: DMT family transporter [Arenimonas sp.]|nr:DMT family transporter [Arenimonas sp.]